MRHGLRLAALLAQRPGGLDPSVERALSVAAIWHEVGYYVEDRGHFVVRGARWAAIHLDDVLPAATTEERRLVGELILFHRHRGSFPVGVFRPDLVETFRQMERWERLKGVVPPGYRDADRESAEAAHPRPPLDAALRRLERREWVRHPRLSRRIQNIRRPDR